MTEGRQYVTAAKEPREPTKLTRTHRILIGVVVAGAVVIAGIGFAGSYAAVRELAFKKGFGAFSYALPVGIDAGICVLLALDLLLTWIRIPFPLLRQTAWLLTAATIAFNGAAAWPDPLGVGMHAVIPILFVVSVEAARHAVGRIADITADKHMEGVRLTRWLLSPLPTLLLWRRMKLWELRSYEAVIKLEQERLVYQARLHSRFGRAWRRKAPVESLMPLRLARYGVPLAQTAPSGLAAAGIEPALLPPAPAAPELVEAAARAVAQQEVPVAEVAEAGLRFETPPQPASHDGGYASSALPEQFQSRTPQSQEPVGDGGRLRFLDAYQAWLQEFRVPPTASQFSEFLLHDYKISTGAGAPLSKEQLLPLLQRLEQMNLTTSVDSNQFWNEQLHPGTAQELDLEDSNPEPELRRDGQLTGAPADRTGGSNRVVVQMRIPAEADAITPGAEAKEPESQGAGSKDVPHPGEDQEQQETLSPRDPSALKGQALVEFHYQQLPPELQQLSANELAPQLVDLTGYKEGTVRKYIGMVRKDLAAQSAGA
ncbi:DUF2637 domain-containing protein [Streptomyces sp. NPDC059349]|uniref:DUF2637 domain-containing protein n=1 Tax=Streptomyces sp. NPDC059349 TaxID=3346808 RepID=UPI0036BA5400